MADPIPQRSTLEPKERFRAVPGSKGWTDFIDSELFQRAAECAMIQTGNMMPSAMDMGQSAANGFRMEGARLFLNTLMRLAEPKGTRPTPTVGLNYNA